MPKSSLHGVPFHSVDGGNSCLRNLHDVMSQKTVIWRFARELWISYTEIGYIVSNRVLSVYVWLIMLFFFPLPSKCPVCLDSKRCANLSVIGDMLSGRVVELMRPCDCKYGGAWCCFWCDVKYACVSGLTGALEHHSSLRRGKGETILTGECLIKVREDDIKR